MWHTEWLFERWMVPCWCNLHFGPCYSHFEQEAIPVVVEACKRMLRPQVQVQGARLAFVQEPGLKTGWHLEPVLAPA